MTRYQSENILRGLPEQRIQNWIQYSLFFEQRNTAYSDKMIEKLIWQNNKKYPQS